MQETIAAIDIGTHKVAAAICRVNGMEIELAGWASETVSDNDTGAFSSRERTRNAMVSSLSKAEQMADQRIRQVLVTQSIPNIKTVTNHGMIEIKNSGGTVERDDLMALLQASRRIPLPASAVIVDQVFSSFKLDGRAVENPLGLEGKKLECDVMVFIVPNKLAKKTTELVHLCDLKIQGIVANPLASAYGALSTEMMQMGSINIDMGGSTTQFSIFDEGRIKFCTTIPYAGDHITNDLMMGLNMNTIDAETLKCQYGRALEQLTRPDLTIKMHDGNGQVMRDVKLRFIASIIEARQEEILIIGREWLGRIAAELDVAELKSGIVLSGNGCLLGDIEKLVQRVFDTPVCTSAINCSQIENPRDRLSCQSAYGAILAYVNGRAMINKHTEMHALTSLWSSIKHKVLNSL